MRNDFLYGISSSDGAPWLDRSAACAAAATGSASVAPGMLSWQDGRDLAFSAR